MFHLFKTISPCTIILFCTCFFIFYLNVVRKIKGRYKKMIGTVVYLVLSFFLFSYLNGLIVNIFSLKYLSVKTYLIVVILVHFIILFTINKKVSHYYFVLNLILFVITSIILGSVLAILIGNRWDSFYVMDISNAVRLINLGMVVFILYLILISVIYIGVCLFSKKEEEDIKKQEDKDRIFSRKFSFSFPKLKKKNQDNEDFLTEEELLHFDRNLPLYIKGVVCNIIFSDSNPENIIKNYSILKNDIHARMVNGYTLEENQMLRSICLKLNVSSLNSIDLRDRSLLNKISVDEYQMLRNLFENRG